MLQQPPRDRTHMLFMIGGLEDYVEANERLFAGKCKPVGSSWNSVCAGLMAQDHGGAGSTSDIRASRIVGSGQHC